MENPHPHNDPHHVKIEVTQSTQFITPQRVILFLVIAAAIVLTLLMLNLTGKFQVALIMALPAAAIALYILINPYAGAWMFILYAWLRPYDFITALRPLRLAIVIEGMTLLSWVIVLIRTKRPIKWDTLNWMYLLFLGNLAFGTYLAMNNFHAYRIFELMLVAFSMYIISTNVIDSIPRLEKILWLWAAIHTFFATRGVFNYLFNPSRAGRTETSGAVGGSFMGDENDIAMAMNTLIPIVFFLFLYHKKFWVRAVCLGMLGAMVASVVSSFSRGGWVGLVLIALYCIWYSGRRIQGFVWGVFASLIFVAVVPQEYVDEIQTISDTKESTADARLKMWTAGFYMFLDHPINGVGPANGGYHMPDYITGVRNPDTKWGRTFHGLFAQLFAETGGVGVILWFSMLIYVLIFLNRIRRRRPIHPQQAKLSAWATGLIGGIIGYLGSGTFLSVVYYPQLWTIYLFSICLLWLQRDIDRELQKKRMAEIAAEQGEIQPAIGTER